LELILSSTLISQILPNTNAIPHQKIPKIKNAPKIPPINFPFD
jgi:hypothetical protein